MTSAHRFDIVFVLIGVVFSTLLWSCHEGDHDPETDHHTLADRLRHATDENDNAGLSSGPWLAGTSYHKIEGIDPGERDSFYVDSRLEMIEQFACSECHTTSLTNMGDPADPSLKAHWDIEVNHADADVMTCTTCHARPETDSVSTLQGDLVSFDHSYRLCAQCHSTQMNDWIGGAHGKRVGGWPEPRVVHNCTSCHNPHAPQWDTRFPARSATVVERSDLEEE